MSLDPITQKAWQAFRSIRRRLWGSSQAVFKNAADATVLTLRDGWIAVPVADQTTGQPMLELNVLERAGVDEAAALSIHRLELRDYVYEKQTQELNSSYPRYWQLQFQPIGRVGAAAGPEFGVLELIVGGHLDLIAGGALELIGAVREQLGLIEGGSLELIGGGNLELIGA